MAAAAAARPLRVRCRDACREPCREACRCRAVLMRAISSCCSLRARARSGSAAAAGAASAKESFAGTGRSLCVPGSCGGRCRMGLCIIWCGGGSAEVLVHCRARPHLAPRPQAMTVAELHGSQGGAGGRRLRLTSRRGAYFSAHSSIAFRSDTLGVRATGGCSRWPVAGQVLFCLSQRSMAGRSYLRQVGGGWVGVGRGLGAQCRLAALHTCSRLPVPTHGRSVARPPVAMPLAHHHPQLTTGRWAA